MGLRLTVKEAQALGIEIPEPPKRKYNNHPDRLDGKLANQCGDRRRCGFLAHRIEPLRPFEAGRSATGRVDGRTDGCVARMGETFDAQRVEHRPGQCRVLQCRLERLTLRPQRRVGGFRAGGRALPITRRHRRRMLRRRIAPTLPVRHAPLLRFLAHGGKSPDPHALGPMEPTDLGPLIHIDHPSCSLARIRPGFESVSLRWWTRQVGQISSGDSGSVFSRWRQGVRGSATPTPELLRRLRPSDRAAGALRIDAPMFVKGVFGGVGRPVMSHSLI